MKEKKKEKLVRPNGRAPAVTASGLLSYNSHFLIQ